VWYLVTRCSERVIRLLLIDFVVISVDGDTAILGTSERSRLRKVLFGSEAQVVLLDSNRLVTAVPAHVSKRRSYDPDPMVDLLESNVNYPTLLTRR